MRKLDPQLEFLVEGGTAQLASTENVTATMRRFGFELPGESAPDGEETARKSARAPKAETIAVLVQFAGDPEALEKAGLAICSIAGDVVTGFIAIRDVAKLEKIAEVERIEAARTMHTDLDLSVVECRANLVHTGPPGRRGAGVIVGICDSGCDFTHPSFRRADGTSRILFIWDQGLTPAGGEAAPAGFGYGVEYTNPQINAALASAAPFAAVRHRDPGLHGTHVAGIAAGDGSVAGEGRPAGTFVGVAPEADLIIVAARNNGAEGLGTSASTLDAVNYIYQHAATLRRPAVVNMSLGDNLGPHDGTSLLERGLDNLLGGAGRAFVKSAGNAGFAEVHAQGTIAAGGTQNVRFNQPAGDTSANQIDIWYRGGDTFRATVVDPAGNATGVVNVGTATTFTLTGGNTVRIDHRNADPFNGDRRIFITMTPGAAGTMRAGNWTIRLVSVASPGGGRFDGWIQRGQVVPGFIAPHADNSRTISTPGTAREVITAANYVTRGAGVGSLASSSSRGPTRDGRAAPTLAAPGSAIISADAENSSGDPYLAMSGTSMAAPHITGTIALMFQKNPGRTQEQIRDCLVNTARADAQTGPVPNTAWGAGKMDSNAAVNCVPSPRPPASVVVTCARSVLTPCLSVPAVSCGVASATITCRPSVVVACRSVPVFTCVQSVAACPSIPQITCGVASVAACVTVVRCPSVIDGCPSTPGGCTLSSAVGCPGGLIDPGRLVNPGLVAGPGIAPGPEAWDASLAGSFAAGAGGYGDVQGGGVAVLPEGWDRQASADTQPDIPDQGFFDYEESWFDASDQ